MTLLADNPPESLELYNKVTGETAEVVPAEGRWPHENGRYIIRNEPDDCDNWFTPDGMPYCGNSYPNWSIRLKQPPATDWQAKYEALVEEVSNAVKAGENMSRFVVVDPWLLHAREIRALAAETTDCHILAAGYRNGDYDKKPFVTIIAAYLKEQFG